MTTDAPAGTAAADTPAAAAADMLAAIRRLTDLTWAEGLGAMVAVFEALKAEGGPLDELGDLFGCASRLVDFDHENAGLAAQRVDDCAGMAQGLRFGVHVAASVTRQLMD